MKKLSHKAEEGVLMGTAMFVLLTSMWEPTVSVVLAILSLATFFAYNFFTKAA